MILTKPQAEAVYSAMCALNNVGAKLIGTTKFPEGANFTAWSEGDFSVSKDNCIRETYDNQAEFAAAYGLQ